MLQKESIYNAYKSFIHIVNHLIVVGNGFDIEELNTKPL